MSMEMRGGRKRKCAPRTPSLTRKLRRDRRRGTDDALQAARWKHGSRTTTRMQRPSGPKDRTSPPFLSQKLP